MRLVVCSRTSLACFVLCFDLKRQLNFCDDAPPCYYHHRGMCHSNLICYDVSELREFDYYEKNSIYIQFITISSKRSYSFAIYPQLNIRDN